MARPTKLAAALRDLVRREVASVMQDMLTLAGATTTKPTNGRRRKRRGPRRPPKNA